MKETDKLCYHPNLPPYNSMTGEKILPTKIWECNCGGNSYCPTCGFGKGLWPCPCVKTEPTKCEKALKMIKVKVGKI